MIPAIKHSLLRSLTARGKRPVEMRCAMKACTPRFFSRTPSPPPSYCAVCCWLSDAVSTRTPAPIVLETLTFFR